MTRRSFLNSMAALSVSAQLAAAPQPKPTRKPNIVFILTDDLGYMDVSSYAAHMRGVPRSDTYYETPYIDELVDHGVAFSQAYANQLCSPTRASLLTGRYHCRIGVTTAWLDNNLNYWNQGETPPPGHHPLDSEHRDNITTQQALLNAKVLLGLPSGQPQDQGWNEICLPEVLKDYESTFIGKWHAGGAGAVGYQPMDQGFKVLAHYDSGGSPHFDWRRHWNPRDWKHWPTHKAVHDQPRNQGSFPGEPTSEYLTDCLTDLVVDYLADRAQRPNEPFLLYFSHFIIHGPWQAKQEDIDYFEKKPNRGWNNQDDPVYAGMMKAMDDSVGRVIGALRANGQLENTVIIFMSDNGGLGHRTSNAPLKAGKAFLYEGGVRVPLVCWWPGHIEGPAWCDVPVHCTDVFSTIADLAGATVPHRVDGQTLMPLLEDPKNRAGRYVRKPIYWHYPMNVGLNHPDTGLPLTPHSGMRKGDYKIIWDWHGKLELYNIAEDLSEEHDLSEQEPEHTRELFRELVTWLDNNVEARYFPKPNPDYQPEEDTRAYPFRDLRKELLGLTTPPGLPDAMGKNAGRP